MNPILTGREVRMNEEHGGRYPIARRAPNTPDLPGQATAAYRLQRVRCTICTNPLLTLQTFADCHTTDCSYWAACGNCGNWTPL